MHFSEDETRSLRPDESVIVLEDAQMLRQKTKIFTFYNKFYFLSSKISKCYKLQNSKYPITSEKINPKFTTPADQIFFLNENFFLFSCRTRYFSQDDII